MEKTSIIRTKILVPTGATNTFLTYEKGNFYIAGKSSQGPKVFGIEKFHCSGNSLHVMSSFLQSTSSSSARQRIVEKAFSTDTTSVSSHYSFYQLGICLLCR